MQTARKGEINLIILGLDAATRKSGISVFDNNQLIYYEKYEIDKKISSPHERMKLLYNELKLLHDKYKYDKIIMEDVPINSRNNLQVGKTLAILQGMIFALCEEFEIEQILYLPSEWRSKVGTYGGTRESTKRDYQKEKAVSLVNEIYKLDLQYYKNENKEHNSDDDVAEAILIGRAYLLTREDSCGF